MPRTADHPSPVVSSPAAPAPIVAKSRRNLGCADQTEVFQHPLLEEPPTRSGSRQERQHYADLVVRARAICGECPVATQCLYVAVVHYDVAGYVAGTTARQRVEIRRRLGFMVEPEDLDTLAGVVGGRRQVDHDEILRLRRTHPDESLEQLAHRLGCSLSTIKRHLRRDRDEYVASAARTARPSPSQVLQVSAAVLRPRTAARAA